MFATLRRAFALAYRHHLGGSVIILLVVTLTIGAQISDRRSFADGELYDDVMDRWGAPIRQPAPSVLYVESGTVFGGLDFAMTLRLDPDRMTQLGITVSDVRDAIQEQNATNPAGTIGREPAPKGTELTLPVTALGRLKTTDQFADVIVRARTDGSFVRVRDIGTVELTSQNLDLVGRLNGHPTANILLYLRPGANQLWNHEDRSAGPVQVQCWVMPRPKWPGPNTRWSSTA